MTSKVAQASPATVGVLVRLPKPIGPQPRGQEGRRRVRERRAGDRRRVRRDGGVGRRWQPLLCDA
eukprot:5940268-Pleurochrysis_carterae.AAC.3